MAMPLQTYQRKENSGDGLLERDMRLAELVTQPKVWSYCVLELGYQDDVKNRRYSEKRALREYDIDWDQMEIDIANMEKDT